MRELAHIRSALAAASESPEDANHSQGEKHRARSQRFVLRLAEHFRTLGKGDGSLRVLSRQCNSLAEFGLNELLHDILVCKVEQDGPKQPVRISRVHWQIESEFDFRAREVVKDFNKLVLGSAENKLFVGSKTSNDTKRLELLRGIAACCTGNVFIALLPHPRDWHLPYAGQDPSFWHLNQQQWIRIEARSRAD
jgi:hypothetical protein